MSNVKQRDPQKGISWRYFVFIGILLAMFGYLTSGLVRLQLVNSEEYKEKAEDVRTKTIVLRGSRGNITDADSVILAKDEKVYNITFYKDGSNVAKSDYYEYTQSIMETVQIIERNGGELAFDYVIQRDEETGEWAFDFGSGVTESVLATREKQWRSNNYVTAKSYPTAEECLQRLKRKYRIVQNEADLDAFKEIEADDKTQGSFITMEEDMMLKVMAVYSEMQMNLFNSLPIPIAEDVAYETVIEVETKAMMLPGMGVEVATKRVYPKHTLAAQIIGYVGKIPSRTKWLELQAEGYSYNDTIGRDGIEYSMESWLTASSNRTQGSRVVERNNLSTVVRELSYTEPEDGNNVKLTIRSAYQQQAERAIANNVEQIRDKQESLMVDSSWLEDNRTDIAKRNWEQYHLELAEHGVMVVLDMQDRVLAMANFPTYDLNALVAGGKEARAILADDRNLMLNYAIGSRATPGSIFKMVTGFGALAEGELGPKERFTDMGYYLKYNADKSTAPKCWISEGQRYKHNAQTIVDAIQNSCNFFFYEMGDRLGEDRLYRYASLYGLTSLTGIDLPGEVRSVVGSQDTLYDPTKALGEAFQDTSMPIIVYNSLKTHLRAQGAKRGLEYEDERLSVCAKRLMDMAINYPQGDWVPQMRIILMEELGMTKTMVYLNEVIQDAYIYLNDIKWGGQQTILTAIGQSVTTITPIAAARYVAAVANGGEVYNVSIIDSIISPEGEILSQREPTLVNRLFDEDDTTKAEYMGLIRQGMAGVTDDTGTAAKYFRNYKNVQDAIAAKTGTAQVTAIDLENNAWFVCFAPRDNPQIAICVFVPPGHSGGMASIAARDFIDWYLDQTELRTTDYVLPAGNSLAP